MTWAIKSQRNIDVVKEWIKADFKNDIHIWGIEPTINRAIVFAVGDRFIEERDGQYLLLDCGRNLAKLIHKQKDLFIIEKAFMTHIGKNTITEQKINDLASKLH